MRALGDNPVLFASTDHAWKKNSLKLHHERHPERLFVVPQVRAEAGGSRIARETGSRCQEWAGHEEGVSHKRSSSWTRDHAGRAVDACGYSSRTREVRHVRVAISVLPAESNVLLRHPVKGRRDIPRLERIAGILREIWRAADCICAVDGWKKSEVTARIRYRSATEGQPVFVLVKPRS